MSLTLLVENNPRFESFYILNLYTWLGLMPKAVNTVVTACDFLEANAGEIKLIITRANIEKSDTAKEILDYLQKNQLEIPVIVIGPGKKVSGSFVHVENSLELKVLIQSAAKALNITAKDMSLKVMPDYFPIPINYFKVLKRSVCPVYVFNPDDKVRFNVLFQKYQDYSPSEISELIDNGVENLYVNKMDRLDFVNNVTSELIVQLQPSQLSEDEQLSAGDKALELLSKKLFSIGVTEETVDLAKKNIEMMKKNVKSHPQLTKLLTRLLSNKTSYMYKHTQVLTYVALHMVRNIDWGTPEQEEKIAFIAFFHDIALATDTQGKIKSKLDLKKANLSTEEAALVEKHAQIAAELVVKFPHAPMGADQIIRQHHGVLNGIGFTEGHSGNVSPMATVFMIAEEFTRIIMSREEGELKSEEMLKELKQEFPTARFQKMIGLLKEITF